MQKNIAAVKGSGVSTVITSCPACDMMWRQVYPQWARKLNIDYDIGARHYSEVVTEKMQSGECNYPDPNPEVQKQWAVFEAMIALMTPQGFAGLMGTMWPELIDLMPFRMGPMMRFMGKIPGALTLMKPMFPILFPRLLPVMMPKVMPVMLDRVGQQVPMPDYMLEQMPNLMPQVMDNLMPHMIGDVVPLVTQPMIDYLRGKTGSVDSIPSLPPQSTGPSDAGLNDQVEDRKKVEAGV